MKPCGEGFLTASEELGVLKDAIDDDIFPACQTRRLLL